MVTQQCTVYVTKWKWQAYSTCDKFLVVSKRYLLDFILAEPEEGSQDTTCAVSC